MHFSSLRSDGRALAAGCLLALSCLTLGAQALASPLQAATSQSPDFPPAEENTVEVAPLSTVDGAIADLATRLNIDSDAVRVVSVQAVTWPNTALGCPQPGRAYAQVVREGQRIILAVGDVQYAYHATDGPAFYCPNPA